MLKIIFVGGEDVSARIELSKKMIELGFKIEIIGTENEQKFKKNHIPYRKYTLNREINISSDLKTIFQLRTLLKAEKGRTIVHAFDTKPTMYLPLAALGLKNIKVVRTITGVGRIFTENTFKNKLLKFVYGIIQLIIGKRVDFTIFQNDDDSAYYIEKNFTSLGKTEVIKSSGLNLDSFTSAVDASYLDQIKKNLKLNFDQKTFILVSRIVKQKGILYYLEAAKKCSEMGYDYNFLLVGQLDQDESITLSEIEAYKNYVTYLGRRSDIKHLLLISDVFVLPTYYREGVPRVLLEASALGLGLIATDMPGCKDVVLDDYNGKRIKIKDSDDLFTKMIYLAEDELRLKKYSENAKEHVKKFDLDIVAEQYISVYKDL